MLTLIIEALIIVMTIMIFVGCVFKAVQLNQLERRKSMFMITMETLAIAMILVMFVGCVFKAIQLDKVRYGHEHYAALMSKGHEAKWEHEDENDEDGDLYFLFA